MTQLYFAPLEGITDAIFRRVHHEHFGGVDKYFIPFVSPTQNLTFNHRELHAIAPELNEGVPAVPQLLTRDAGHFRWASEALRDMGYTEVNLNIGCPSGTVTAKVKGSGLLREPDVLRELLDGVFAHSALPVSIKTRIGFYDAAEWPSLWEILRDYPMHELIVHPRTRNEFYKGEPHMDTYALAAETACCPLVYNGNIFAPADAEALLAAFPATSALMLGRGLIANPALAQMLKGGAPLEADKLRDFIEHLFCEYRDRHQLSHALGRIRDVMKHTACCFEDPAKAVKLFRKASTEADYRAAMTLLFSHPLTAAPAYDTRFW
ncbi:MAG: tRNA-dihydrouridine synthase family protein [Clostridia bacterium]|nr:tRNA-dihydrouridine synthase family protein [Clostridia bacterium]